MSWTGEEQQESLISIHWRIFKIGYARELRPLAVLGAVCVVIALPLTYCQNLSDLKTRQIDFLNSSAVGPDWIGYFSYLGEKEFYITAITFASYVWNIPVGIVFAFLFATSLFFSFWLKELFADSRPLWFAGDNLSAGTSGCSSHYGQPSSHALMAVNFFLFPLIIFVVTHKWINPWLKALGYAIFAVLVALVSWSRLTLAVHFPYQIALGISFGILFMPVSLYLLAYVWERLRNFNLLKQSIAAGVILILGNLIAVLSMQKKPNSFDLYILNSANCEKDDLPDQYASMHYVLSATGMLTVYPYILCYHQAHELQPAADKSIWSVMLFCFITSIIMVFSVSFVWTKVVSIDTAYWEGIVQFELISGIITALMTLFLPMLFYRVGMLQTRESSNQKHIQADKVELGLQTSKL